MVTRIENGQGLFVREHSGDGVESARQGFAHQGEVGLDTLMFFGEEFAGSAKSSLDLIEDEQDVVAIADFAHFFQVTGRRDNNTSFTLNRFHQKGNRIGGDGPLQGFCIPKGDGDKSRREGTESVSILRFSAEPDDGDGPPMKIVGADDDFSLIFGDPFVQIAPLSDGLDRGFDGFGSAVHGKDLVGIGHFADLLAKQRQLIIPKGP